MNVNLIAQLTFAGAMVGFLIGPDSLDRFIGIIPNHAVILNVIVGGAIGAALGIIGSFAKEID